VEIARTFAIQPDDYPDASARAEEEGTTGIRVVVNTEGKVSACQVVKPSGFNRLDDRACQIAQRRWRFKPATENGEPVEATINKNFRWVLPKN
jgi:protein TonB